MATSPKTFLIELYREYLDEASFLYDQRLHLLGDSEVTWKRIGGFEERFEAHIDGLVVGGDLALEVCKKQALEGDSGELHAAIRVFCRQRRQDLLFETLQAADIKNPGKFRAVCEALKHELPELWQPELKRMLYDDDGKLAAVAASVIGFRRLKWGELGKLLAGTPAASLPLIIQVIGRVNDQGAREPLLKLLRHDQAEVCLAAALALLRLGEEQAVDYCHRSVGTQPWAALPLGLGGGRSASTELLERCRSKAVSDDALIALGLHGSTSAIPTLLRHLDNPDLAPASASALQAITGAGLSETVFLPEQLEAGDLPDGGQGKPGTGQLAMRPDGKPYGTTVTRCSVNSQEWTKWWQANGGNFHPNARYRYGAPYSPSALLDTLKLESSPHVLRRWAAEELAIRYNCDVPFETDLLVKDQESALTQCARWVAANGGRFNAGEWYFAGRLVP